MLKCKLWFFLEETGGYGDEIDEEEKERQRQRQEQFKQVYISTWIYIYIYICKCVFMFKYIVLYHIEWEFLRSFDLTNLIILKYSPY